MKIMKFGGSSVGTAKRMLHVAEIVKKFNMAEQVVVVVSAMYNVTDMLISIFQKYKNGKFTQAFEETRNVYTRHMETLDKLQLPHDQHRQANTSLLDLFGNLS